MDYDPDGLGVLATYKHGSLSLAHENAVLISPNIIWIGMKSCSYAESSFAKSDDYKILLRLSARDRRQARCMLRRPLLAHNGKEKEWRRELQVMLMLNLKNEIEVLDSTKSEQLENFLLDKVHSID